METVVYDIEVLRGPDDVEGGWNNPYGMGFGTAVVYSYQDDLYHFFAPDQRDALIDLLTGKNVVSFNGIKFDNRVILGNDYEEGERAWMDYDVLLEVIKSKFNLRTVAEAEKKLGDAVIHDGSISLDGLSQGTLSLRKTGHGAKAPELIRNANWAEVFAYNLNDVRLTKKLYDFIQRYGFLVDRLNNTIRIARP